MEAWTFRCGRQSLRQFLYLFAIGFFVTGCSGGPLELLERLADGEFTIMPRTSTIQPGATVQLKVQGNAGQLSSLVWSAAPEEVAEVDSDGRVVGRRAGKAIIKVTNGRLIDSAVVRVKATGVGALPGVPDGYRLLADNSLHELHAAAWTVAWNDRKYLRIVEDRSAPRSCCRVAEFFYPRGFEAGRGPASLDLSLPQTRGLYVSMWWKASENWHGHPTGVNKLIFVFGSGGPGDWTMVWHGKGALRFAPQHPRGWKWLDSNVDAQRLREGTWYHIEFLLEQHDGEFWDIKWWVDGTLRGRHDRVRWSDTRLGVFKVNPTWGGVGGRKSRDDHFWWDHIQVSGAP